MRFFLLIVCGFSPFFISVLGQNDTQLDLVKKERHVVFVPIEEQKGSFDNAQQVIENNHYEKITIGKGLIYSVPVKSIGKGQSESIQVKLRGFRNPDLNQIEFRVNDSSEVLSFIMFNDSTLTLYLPAKKSTYSVVARYKKKVVGKIKIAVYKTIYKKIILVKLGDYELDEKDLNTFLNNTYSPSKIQFNIIEVHNFSDSLFNENTIFDNPSPNNDRYTRQMRNLRDAYFEANPNANINAYYVFLIPGFTDPSVQGYMTSNKAMAFIKYAEPPYLNRTLARELGFGIGMLKKSWENNGPSKGSTMNLMDINGGLELSYPQWESLRHSSSSFSFFDEDEDVKTNNGMVAYYFWEENEDGFIELNGDQPLNQIRRPYKKNYLSFHLNIQDVLFEIIFTLGDYFICWWHIITLSFFTFSYLVFRFVVWFRRRKTKEKPGFFKRKLVSWPVLASAIGLTLLSFQIINAQFSKYEVTSGLIQDFKGHSINKVSGEIIENKNLRHSEEEELKSEVLVKKNKNWYVKRRKKVLYFDVFKDSVGIYKQCRYNSDHDSLILKSLNYREVSASHYVVFNYYSEDGRLETQKAYNHLGVEISNKLKIKDPAKRILLFVNGYRPTSVGHSFEDRFMDIKAKGLEFPNSSNLIYSFDRFDYWRPWNEIDLLFQKRINPTDSYYADGHFSVSTSNYKSLIDFTTISAQYPKRCSNPKKHNCYKIQLKSTGFFGDKERNTYHVLPTDPNRKGFRIRKENGQIAAKNMLMMLNEIPNRSLNDTLYIVAHSMGYAYALGMIDEFRGKVHFGGFYIIAPENASQGDVLVNEWKEVWQYGSKWNKKEKDAPCLQDGVAPQFCAGGLSEANRAYIPNHFYKRKGFFDSHFVGYFTWIFDIDQGEKGAIKQR